MKSMKTNKKARSTIASIARQNRLRIPSEFQLMGRTIRVEWTPELVSAKQAVGESVFMDDLIRLHKGPPEMSAQAAENTFLHELVHFCLHMMGQKDLTYNEEFVRLFSGLLHQALVTARYTAEAKP